MTKGQKKHDRKIIEKGQKKTHRKKTSNCSKVNTITNKHHMSEVPVRDVIIRYSYIKSVF